MSEVPVTYLEPTNTLQFTAASPQSPDILAIISKDANAAAATVIVLSPLPAVGTQVLLQIVSHKCPGPTQFWRTIATGDTPASIALLLAQQIMGVTALGAVGIGGQYVAGTAQFGVSHRFDDPMTVSAAAWNAQGQQIQQDNGGVFIINQGRSILDAGPQFALIRIPDGWVPTAGSNIGQIPFEGPTVETPGIAAQYGTIAVNIIDPHSATIRGEIEFDTVGLVQGQVSIVKRFGIGQGIYAEGCADMGPGTINLSGGVFLNGTRVA